MYVLVVVQQNILLVISTVKFKCDTKPEIQMA